MRSLVCFLLLFLYGCTVTGDTTRNYIISQSTIEEIPVSHEVEEEE